MRSVPLVAIRRRAAVALLLLTALTGGSYALQQIDRERDASADKTIEVVSRQELLTQRVALLVQALSGDMTPGQRASAHQRLARSIVLMDQSNGALMGGDAEGGVPAIQTAATRQRFTAIQPQIKDFISHARAAAARDRLTAQDPDVRYVRAAAQTALLTRLKGVVEAEKAKVSADADQVQRIYIGIVVSTLLVLL